MPPSQLYEGARSLLDKDKSRCLDSSETWLAAQPSGEPIRSNIHQESHLVGSGAFGDPAAYKEFLQGWCCRHDGAGDDRGRKDCFIDNCSQHERQGTAIPGKALPDTLNRYVVSKKLFETLVMAILGDDALLDLQFGIMSVVDAFKRMKDEWKSENLSEALKLGQSHKDTVFATFSNVRHTTYAGNDLAKALGHPVYTASITRSEIIFEFSYPTAKVDDHRIPTVADAGWNPLFQPAPEVPLDPEKRETCCGWTKPIAGPSQPEIVHRNAPLKVVPVGPRFQGWITP